MAGADPFIVCVAWGNPLVHHEMQELMQQSRFDLYRPVIALGNVMSAIGPVLHDPAAIDWDTISYHGSFNIFRDTLDGDFLLRCVVWRAEAGEIFGHNFDLTRTGSHDWWTAFEASTPEACIERVNPKSRSRARIAVREFREKSYAELIAGLVSLHEVANRDVRAFAPFLSTSPRVGSNLVTLL